MEFIVKDLMISVLPTKLDLGEVTACGACSSDSSGPPCSGICPGSKNPFEEHFEGIRLEQNPFVLAALMEQLQAHVVAVEARQAALHKQLTPTSAADVETVRAHLTAALESLDAGAASAE